MKKKDHKTESLYLQDAAGSALVGKQPFDEIRLIGGPLPYFCIKVKAAAYLDSVSKVRMLKRLCEVYLESRKKK